MRTRFAVMLAGVLVLAACADADDATRGGTPAPTATDDTTTGGAATEAPTAAGQAELSSSDLPDGVAATVGDARITTEAVEKRLALVREIPQVQEQLQGDDTELAEAQLRREVLGRLVLQRVVLQGAAAEGIEVGDEQVAEDRSQLVEEAGGQESFAEQLAQAGVPEGQLTEELRASIAFELVTEKLLEQAEAGDEPTATEGDEEPGTELEAPTPGATPDDPTEQVQQDWLVELVAKADVVVDEQYGAWNPSTGQVVPE